MKTQRGLVKLAPLALAILLASLSTLGFIDADVAVSRAAIAPDHITCAGLTADLEAVPADVADRICAIGSTAPAAASVPAFTVDSTAWRSAYSYAQQLTEQAANAAFSARFGSTARWEAYSYAQELTEQAANAAFASRFATDSGRARWNAYTFAQSSTEQGAYAAFASRFTITGDGLSRWNAYSFAQALTEQGAASQFINR